MGHPAFELDWNLVRTFVAVAQAGSLASGARSLGLTHPTAARHIQMLEEALGVGLFSRTGKGLVLNESGRALIAKAESMHSSALAFQAATDTLRAQPVERLRISVAGLLAELVPELLASQIGVSACTSTSVDMIVTNDLVNLLQRDADIALRHVRPHQQELLCRRVGTLVMGLYGSEDYAQKLGPINEKNCSQHRFIDGLTQDSLVRGAAKQGLDIDPSQILMRSDSLACQRAAVDAGIGAGAFPAWMAKRYPHWVALTDADNVIDVEVWLVARPEVRDSAQLKSLYSNLGGELEQLLIAA